MLSERSSGILLHPTSLPGPFGIGDLGPAADRWIEWLAKTGCASWQVLPLGPTGYGDSPYQSFSAFAGNPYLISPERLAADGLLTAEDLAATPGFPPDRIDFGGVIPWKLNLLATATERFRSGPPPGLADEYATVREREGHWVDDYALFMALKGEHGGGSWLEWPSELRVRDESALSTARARLASEIEHHLVVQFLFFRQWSQLRERARGHGLQIIGDIPIFVSLDSCDVWANPELFQLDAERWPTVVAGVPPDYFSETGQLWGNPLYDWDVHTATGYAWWISRIKAVIEMVDVIRIDHFRGFVDYWEISAGAPNAVLGRWIDGPGRAFFDAIEAALGELPIIAEDLGELHATVPALRDELKLPGMKVLQFAFDGDPNNEFLPRFYPENCAAYTGTHDNDTVVGWWQTADRETRDRARATLGFEGDEPSWPFIDAVWKSQARLAVAPLQAFLELGPEARMNTPSTESGNWSWRLDEDDLTEPLAERIAELNRRTNR